MGLTQAAVLVAALAKRIGPTEMALKLGVTEGGVRSHAAGRAAPRRKVQERYLEVYGVPIDAWERPADGAGTPAGSPDVPKKRGKVRKPPPVPDPPPSATGSASPTPPARESVAPDALAEVTQLLATVRRQLEAAEDDDDTPYSAKAALITAGTSACKLLAQLSGQLEITQASIVRSGPWKRILIAFEEVFSRHPEAQKALAEFAGRLEEIGA